VNKGAFTTARIDPAARATTHRRLDTDDDEPADPTADGKKRKASD
jgi:hypothetical protein